MSGPSPAVKPVVLHLKSLHLMSCDYYVFTKQSQPVTSGQLVAALQKRAINSYVFREIDPPKSLDGEITGYCAVVCWQTESFTRADLIEMFRSENTVERDKYFEDGVLGYCNVFVSSAGNFLENFDGEYFERSVDQMNSQVLAEAKCAETVYEISTSSGRSDRSSFLQAAVCKSIAELSVGIIEDPQEGEFFWSSEADAYFGINELS